MAAEFGILPIVVTSIGLTVTAVSTIPSVVVLAQRCVPSKRKSYLPVADIYEDEDGTSTHDSVAAFSDRIPKTIIYISTTIGLFSSITLAILSSISQDAFLVESWLQLGSWVGDHVDVLYLR
jgi:hypothetical protein